MKPFFKYSIQTCEALKGEKVGEIVGFTFKNQKAGRKGIPRRFLPCKTHMKAPAWLDTEQGLRSPLLQRIILRAAVPEASHHPV